MGRRDDIVVGLDVGTTKVCAIVGELTDTGVDVVGIGTAPSKGLRKGTVVNLEATIETIRRAIEEAELMAGCEISEVLTGIAGGHIKGFNSHGIVAVKERDVKAGDVSRVLEAAQAVAIPMDRKVVAAIPQEFVVDDQAGVRDPLGMAGVRLEARVHIVTAAVTSARNIVNACKSAGLHVADLALQQLASAEAVLTDDERELGVALVDIGGGTTDIAVFMGNSVVHTAVLALGGNHLTSDIAQGLRTPKDEAERLKQKYGCALTSLVAPHEEMSVPSVGGRDARTLSRQILSEIIEARMEEILLLVRRELERAGVLEELHSGVVLTGGATLLSGLTDLAEDIFELEVRRGTPDGVGGLTDVVRSPKYATGVGLVLQAAGRARPGSDAHYVASASSSTDHGIYRRIDSRMKDWIRELF